MRAVSIFLFFVLAITKTYGQTDTDARYIDASQLTMIGKALPTSHLYHRIDTTVHKRLTPSENQQARCSAGLALTFSTNSSFIELLPTYKWEHKKDNMTGIAAAGFDLYIKRENKWVYAGSGAPRIRNEGFNIIKDMDTTEKECLLYLPIYSELESLKIGIQKTATIKTIPNPFKFKVVFFGSSFTQGTSASRPGMSYPMQIERNLDIHVCNLGFAGNAKLQPYFAELIADIDADAFVFDAFSNPSEEIIRERLVSFLEIIRKKHKKTPLIFVQTIHRGNTNFDLSSRRHEEKKKEAAKEIMTELVQKFSNVHLIESPLPESISDDTSADGVHPSDLGYYCWANNLGDKLNDILNLKTKKLKN